MVVMVLSFVMGKGLFKRTFVAIAWSGTIAVLAVYAHTIYTALVEMREGTVSARFAGYSKVLVAATSSPLNFLFGSGKGAFIYKYELTMPHNFVLDLLVGKGIITVIIACLVFYIISARLVALAREQKGGVRRTGEGFEVPLIVALAGFFIMGMSAPITNSIILWTLLAVACSFISIVGEEEEIRVRLQDTARDVPELRSSRTGEARASLGPLMADGRTP